MPAGRPVRIPRRPLEAGIDPRAIDAGYPTATEEGPTYRRNTGGTRRVARIYLLFLTALLMLYAFFLALDLSTIPSAAQDSAGLLGFTTVGIALAGLGAVLTFGQAPRGVMISARSTIFIERWGRRIACPPSPELKVRLLRRHATGLLSPIATENVEIVSDAGVRRTYLISSDLLPSADRGGSR